MPAFLNLEGLVLTTEQGKWKRIAEGVARDVIGPNAEEVDRSGRFPKENICALGKAGLLGLLVPKEYGGGGQTIVTSVVVTEALAKACAATAMSYHMHQTTIPLMCATATPEQVERFIAPIVRGERLGAFAMTEPGSGNKIWHMDSFARRRPTAGPCGARRLPDRSPRGAPSRTPRDPRLSCPRRGRRRRSGEPRGRTGACALEPPDQGRDATPHARCSSTENPWSAASSRILRRCGAVSLP